MKKNNLDDFYEGERSVSPTHVSPTSAEPTIPTGSGPVSQEAAVVPQVMDRKLNDRWTADLVNTKVIEFAKIKASMRAAAIVDKTEDGALDLDNLYSDDESDAKGNGSVPLPDSNFLMLQALVKDRADARRQAMEAEARAVAGAPGGVPSTRQEAPALASQAGLFAGAVGQSGPALSTTSELSL